jgi:iron complex outermembrane receptor protein
MIAHHIERTKGIPTAPWGGLFGDPDTRSRDRRGFLDASYAVVETPSLQLGLRGAVDWSIYNGTWPYLSDEQGTEALVLSVDQDQSLWFGAGTRLGWQPWGWNRLEAGVEVRRAGLELGVWEKAASEDGSETIVDVRETAHFTSFFLQDEIAPVRFARFTLGARYDHYESFGGTATPRLGLVLRPRSDTAVKVLYGEGFRAPNLGERKYTDGYEMLPNPDLVPERSETFEIVLERSLAARVWTRLSGYRIRIHDLIGSTEVEDGSDQYQNQGEARIRGIEAEIRAALGRRVQAKAGLAFQDEEDEISAAGATNSPRWLGNLGMILPIVSHRLTLGVEGSLVDARHGVHEGARAGRYVCGDANLLWKTPIRPLTASLKVLNFADERYEDPAGLEHEMGTIRQDGRTWRLLLRYRAGER